MLRVDDEVVHRASTMRTLLIAVFVLTVLPAAEAGPGHAPEPPPVATHVTRGVVKSLSTTTLVVTRRHHGDITFTIDPRAQWDGPITIGSAVSVRYREEGQTHVASAVVLHHPTE